VHASRFRGAQKNFDLFHAVNYVPPGRLHKPALPIIYDLSHIRYPQLHPNERVHWLETNFKSINRAAYIQTISEFTKSEIVSILGVSPDRVFVTYPAPGEYFRPERTSDDGCLTKYRLVAGNYFLVVGTREPRKNFKTVALAYATLPEALRRRFPLLWVGPAGWGDVELSVAVGKAMEAGQIRIIGYIPDHDLAALYRNTKLFLMPSIYEGFGMPLVEALACRAPAAVSKISVFEEIAGRCVRYVEPLDTEAWRRAMQDAIDARGASIIDSEASINLARFSWHASARTTLDLYRRCLSVVGN
jgi:alpha-1,3-rhamnosyl/mannosyltransferase